MSDLLQRHPLTNAPVIRAQLDWLVSQSARRPCLAEYVIERLIEALDRQAGDPDLEPESEAGICDGPHDPEPDEPSLGSLDRRIDQRGWAARAGASDDRESNLVVLRPALPRSKGGRHG